MPTKLKLISLFSGAGELDLGSGKAGFEILVTNKFDKNTLSLSALSASSPMPKIDKNKNILLAYCYAD